jgi:hypothetical protein
MPSSTRATSRASLYSFNPFNVPNALTPNETSSPSADDFDSDGGMVGDGYMRQLQPVIAQMPYMGIPGSE